MTGCCLHSQRNSTCHFAPAIGCAAVTNMDQGIPGSLASQLVLGLGIGELKLMTRVAKIGVAVTDRPPAAAVTAWELNDFLDHAAVAH